ncbi:halocin C8-like domain-containing protein [Halorussus sp. MSC15.2]|uniref:halocin C8-like domain-containing protein n=1 Tax=Halorussus sp. MSC15.2 TaxID=2283638 RepID=UPI0013CFCA8B|nr:halocin C8-like domain-containing protein [Halorussus sp. MSC15.2]NEU58157.1 hypothetical protein [Halorussus sp. MSC15.2]
MEINLRGFQVREKEVVKKVKKSKKFEVVRNQLAQAYSVQVRDETEVIVNADENGEPFQVVSFETEAAIPNGEVEFVAVVQGKVVKAEGSILHYEGGELSSVDQYVFSEGELKTNKVQEITVPAQSNQPSMSPQNCGCGDIPDICPYCKSAVPVICFVGCGSSLSAICNAISGAAPGAATCFGVVSTICEEISDKGCAGKNATRICEMAGLCQ